MGGRGGGGGFVCVCGLLGEGRGALVVDVNVTPTPSNAPDPEQMAGQGLSAEPELIACAMSYCLRTPPPKLSNPPAILIFAPRTLLNPPPTPFLPSCLTSPFLSPSSSAGSRPLYSFTRSPFHSFTCGLIHRTL